MATTPLPFPAGPLRVAVAELDGAGGTLDERVGTARGAVAEAAAGGAALVVLPEAYLPGYAHVRADAGGLAQAAALQAAGEHGIHVALGYLDGDGCHLGLAAPDGGWWTYRKRFPSPAERKVWAPGSAPVIAQTALGRVGLLICADVLQPQAWEDLVGRVDLVAVAAAWPDYRGRAATANPALRPLLRWLEAESTPFRDTWLSQAAARVGAPVVFANARGPWRGDESFAGGSGAWSADGSRALGPERAGGVRLATVSGARAPEGAPLKQPWRWAALARAWRVGLTPETP